MKKDELITYVSTVRKQIDKLRGDVLREVERTKKTSGSYLFVYNEICKGSYCFFTLMSALDSFIFKLTHDEDLPAGELVMCKAHEDNSENWELQYYLSHGETRYSNEDKRTNRGWLYIVPLKYFKPTSTDWRPAESYNWANFGEEK